MQAALEVTARHCSKEVDAYGQCVVANPSSWQQDCHRLKVEMTKCTSAHPIVQKIRQECAEPFTAFEQCLKENQTAVANCTEYVQKFLLCADQDCKTQLSHFGLHLKHIKKMGLKEESIP